MIDTAVKKLNSQFLYYYFINIYTHLTLLVSENDVDMLVLPTVTESDLQEIGVSSFGVRRKIVVLAKRLQEKCEAAPTIVVNQDCNETKDWVRISIIRLSICVI